MKKRYDITYLPLGAGAFYGAERSLLGIAEGMVKRGKRVLVLAEEPLKVTEFAEAVRVIGADLEWVEWSPDKNNFYNLFAAIKIFSKLDTKIVHINMSWRRGGWLVALVARLFGKARIVVTARAMPDPHSLLKSRMHFGFIPGIGLWRLPDIFMGNIWARVTHMAVSLNRTDSPERLVRDYGFKKEKIRTIYNGIPVRQTVASEEARRKTRERIGLKDGDIAVCYVGRVTGEKGVDVLIRAVAQLPPNFHLLIVGKGDQKPTLVLLARDLNTVHRVHFFEYISDPSDIVAASDIVSIPSLWYEQFGRIVIEAMNEGVPVVASRIGGMAELFEEGVEGIYVEPNNVPALAEALRVLGVDPEKRRVMGQAGRKLVKSRYSIERVVAEYSELYDTIS